LPLDRRFDRTLAVNNPQQRATVPDKLQAQGGLGKGTSAVVSKESGIPEADIYGVGSFFHLLAEPDIKVRVCQGLACKMAGADEVLSEAEKAGLPVKACSCLAACDQAPAVLKERRVLYKLGCG
jgi:NADH:ubiquinone oxidoreductase subunit E